MTSLLDHHSGSIQKLLLIGDSGAGKTGSMVSLIEAGYKLRILDLDNGLDALKNFALHQGADLSLVEYETVRDTYKIMNDMPVVKGTPKAFANSMKLMTTWSDGTDPAEWGSDTIFVLDSLTALGRVAFEWAKAMNAVLPKPNPDPRNWFYTAQRACEDVIALLSGAAFATNVIIISHVTMVELEDGTKKGYPSAIGVALSKHVGKYFNTMLLADTKRSGDSVKRLIKTVPTFLIDLKNPAPFKVESTLPLETGLATVFKALSEHTNTTETNDG